MAKVLVATEKPFSKVAVDGIKEITDAAGYELSLLEKYTEKSQLLAAVADADALIIRSDKVDAEVLNAAPKLKIVVRAGAGYDNIDLEAATAHKVVAMNTPGQNANSRRVESKGRSGPQRCRLRKENGLANKRRFQRSAHLSRCRH